jgi:hypothetical protein
MFVLAPPTLPVVETQSRLKTTASIFALFPILSRAVVVVVRIPCFWKRRLTLNLTLDRGAIGAWIKNFGDEEEVGDAHMPISPQSS